MKLHTSIKDGFLYSASAVSLGVITVIREKKPDNIYIYIYTHTICSTHDLHKPDLGTFLFSRYPSVALARNRRAKISSGSEVARTPRTQSAPRLAREMPGNLHAGARNENVDRHITLLSSDIFSGPDA